MKTNSITDVMTKNVVCITPNQDLLDVKHIYEKKEFHHHIPVVESDKLIGMVSLLDFMYHISGAGLADDNDVYKKLKVKDIMTTNPFCMSSEVTVEDVANVLTQGNYHAVPILENDKIVGIVSTADIIKYFLKEA
ncbi:MAG: CBS domain-containing protein [Psychroserpens sp.]|uniref:CBS domain-containing protein n=1 Tax=Psychroserpens sp. TaxID=2020870 RepID=UPI00300135F0